MLEANYAEIDSRIYSMQSDIAMLQVSLNDALAEFTRMLGDHEYDISEAKETAESAHCLVEDLSAEIISLTEKLSTIENDVSDILLLKD